MYNNKTGANIRLMYALIICVVPLQSCAERAPYFSGITTDWPRELCIEHGDTLIYEKLDGEKVERLEGTVILDWEAGIMSFDGFHVLPREIRPAPMEPYDWLLQLSQDVPYIADYVNGSTDHELLFEGCQSWRAARRILRKSVQRTYAELVPTSVVENDWEAMARAQAAMAHCVDMAASSPLVTAAYPPSGANYVLLVEVKGRESPVQVWDIFPMDVWQTQQNDVIPPNDYFTEKAANELFELIYITFNQPGFNARIEIGNRLGVSTWRIETR